MISEDACLDCCPLHRAQGRLLQARSLHRDPRQARPLHREGRRQDRGPHRAPRHLPLRPQDPRQSQERLRGMHQAYHCVKIIIDVNSYFHVVQSVHKTWNNPRVLIHLSAIALQSLKFFLTI